MEESSSNRKYRVVLLDKTTSARINLLIRELTGVSKLQASKWMNSPPSVIAQGLTLHQAVDVKSRLARIGARAKVESYDEDEEAAIIPPPDEEPEIIDETAEPQSITTAPDDNPPEGKFKTVAQMIEETDEESQEEDKKKRKKFIPLFFMFFLVIVIIILIIYLRPHQRLIERLKPNRITMYQDESKLPQKLKKSAQDFLPKRFFASNDTSKELALQPDELPPSYEGEFEADSGSVGGEGIAASPEPAGEPSVGTDDEGALAAESIPEPGEGVFAPLNRGAGGGASPGSSSPGLPPSAGLVSANGTPNQQAVENLLHETAEALRNGDLSAAKRARQQLKLAEALAHRNSGAKEGIEIEPAYRPLLQELELAAARAELAPGVDFYPELTGVRIRLHTNLPDNALLKVMVEVPGIEVGREFTLPVIEDMITIPDLGGLPSGKIIIKLIMLPMDRQPETVQEIAGPEAENITGPYTDEDGEIEYETSLTNSRARIRGDVSPQNAEQELSYIAASLALKDYQVSGFEDVDPEAASFITLTAEDIDESNFIVKACRSVGMLSLEMDQPPEYLRLIIDNRQYFIRTVVCRKLLRDFPKDDPAGYDFLLNNIIPL